MPQPTHNLPAATAYDLLLNGQSIKDAHVQGELAIQTSDGWNQAVIFENCIVESFSGSVTGFHQAVKFFNCHFHFCEFIGSYFYAGLSIQNCVFDDYLDFQSGCHNKPGHPVHISNNEFKGFVNFFDCIYEGEFSLVGNHFHKGCNVLGKIHGIPTSFYVEPIIKDNIGEIDLNHEGDYV